MIYFQKAFSDLIFKSFDIFVAQVDEKAINNSAYTLLERLPASQLRQSVAW